MPLHEPDEPPRRRRPSYVIAGILLVLVAALCVFAVTRAIHQRAPAVRPGTEHLPLLGP